MSAYEPALLLLLLFAATPLGFVLTRGLLPARSRVARAGTATLAGLGACAAAAHALVCLGVRGRIAIPAVAAGGLVLAAMVFLASRRTRSARPTVPRSLLLEVLPLAVLVAALAFPLRDSLDYAIAENDTIRIWAPKATRALDEAPPRLEGWDQAHPEYPRGVGILTAGVAMPADGIDPRLPRFVPLFLFAMALLVIFDALSSRGNAAGAFAAMVILGSIPVVLRHATSGLMDLPLAGFVLLGGVGIAPQRGGRPAVLVALAGACGALVTKDEGLVAAGALAAVLLWRLLRAKAPWRALAAAAAIVLVAAPWVALRSKTRDGEPFLIHSTWQNAGLILSRCDAMLRELGHLAFGLADPSPGGFELPDVIPGRDVLVHAAIACAIVLLAFRRGRFPVLPVGILLLVDFGRIVLSTVGIDWQLVTAYNRLVLQGFPLLLLAAVDVLTSPAAAPEAAEARAAAAA